MSRRQKDPLRALSADERTTLQARAFPLDEMAVAPGASSMAPPATIPTNLPLALTGFGLR